MVDTIGLANAVGNAPDYTGRQARQINAVGFAGATAARPLGARTGVRPGTPSTTVTATATTWSCGEFAGLADLMVAAEAGPYPFAFDAVAGGNLTPADSNNPRTDIVYVLVTDPEDGTTVPTSTRGYLAGSPNSNPTAPAAPTGAFTIATISVPKVGAGSPSVTWVAPYVAAAGGILPTSGAAAYPSSPHTGQQVDDAALGHPQRYNGAGWVNPALATLFADRGAAPGAANVTDAGTWQDVPSVTVTGVSAGGTVEIEWDATALNASGTANYYTISYQLLCDGVAVGGTRVFSLPGVASVNPSYSVHAMVRHTPAAGTHTWKLQAFCGAANAVGTTFAAIKVTTS